MNILRKFLFHAVNFLFPGLCALCGKSFIYADEIRYALCIKCRLSIIPVQDNKCNICGKPLISCKDTCLECRNTQRSYDRLWVLYPYIGKYRKLLTAYKFGKRLALSVFLAEKIMETIKNNPVLKDAVIVPVPPRPGKIKYLGWDQIDYLSKVLKKYSGNQTVSYCLKRSKSKIQKRLNRTQRIENLKGRIYLKKSAPKTVLLIDDVTTTGSTMEVCAHVLKEGGSKKVYAVSLFYN